MVICFGWDRRYDGRRRKFDSVEVPMVLRRLGIVNKSL